MSCHEKIHKYLKYSQKKFKEKMVYFAKYYTTIFNSKKLADEFKHSCSSTYDEHSRHPKTITTEKIVKKPPHGLLNNQWMKMYELTSQTSQQIIPTIYYTNTGIYNFLSVYVC